MNPLLAVGAIILASAFIAVTTLIAKILGSGPDALSPFQMTWGRYVFALMGLLIIAAVGRPKIAPYSIPLHLGRVVFGVSGVTAMFAAATLIPLADATAISFLNPVIAVIIAGIVLREKIGAWRVGLAILAFVGALLLIRPGSSAFQPAALVALLAALLIGIEVNFVKVLSDREPTFQILLASNVFGAILACAVAPFVWEWPSAWQWALLVVLGLTMLSAQMLYVSSLRGGDASFLVPFTYATLLFAAIYDWLIFGSIPVSASIAGGLIIVVSGILLAIKGRSAH